MCSLTTECVLLLQNVFSYYRTYYEPPVPPPHLYAYLTTECVLSLQNVFSYYRMCSLTTERITSLPCLRRIAPLDLDALPSLMRIARL